MIAATDKQIEALADVHEQMPEEFDAILSMVTENARTDERTAIARGASQAREENCGRAQVWGEIRDLLAGATDRFKLIEDRRKQEQQERRRDQGFNGPYEEPLNSESPTIGATQF